MDIRTQNEIPDYVKNLPKNIQDVIFDSAWQNRTREIVKKYSLNQVQTDTLLDEVIYILIGLETGEKILDRITQEIGISRLLAEQIVNDLDARVFQYAVSMIENNKKSTPTQTVQPTPQKESIGEFFKKQTNLEVRPENLPMIEKQPLKIDASIPKYIPPASAPNQLRQPPKPEVPANLPTQPKGLDPYREPLE